MYGNRFTTAKTVRKVMKIWIHMYVPYIRRQYVQRSFAWQILYVRPMPPYYIVGQRPYRMYYINEDIMDTYVQ